VTPADRGECGARGQSLVSFALGRLGHQPAGTMTGVRGASLQLGRDAGGKTPPLCGGFRPTKHGPTLSLRDEILPRVRAVVERREAGAPAGAPPRPPCPLPKAGEDEGRERGG
jgi:hypothetical protein